MLVPTAAGTTRAHRVRGLEEPCWDLPQRLAGRSRQTLTCSPRGPARRGAVRADEPRAGRCLGVNLRQRFAGGAGAALALPAVGATCLPEGVSKVESSATERGGLWPGEAAWGGAVGVLIREDAIIYRQCPPSLCPQRKSRIPEESRKLVAACRRRAVGPRRHSTCEESKPPPSAAALGWWKRLNSSTPALKCLETVRTPGVQRLRGQGGSVLRHPRGAERVSLGSLRLPCCPRHLMTRRSSSAGITLGDGTVYWTPRVQAARVNPRWTPRLLTSSLEPAWMFRSCEGIGEQRSSSKACSLPARETTPS